MGEGREASHDADGQRGEVLVPGRREGHERQRAVGGGPGDEQAVGHERVDVGIEAERAREALDEGHRSRVTVARLVDETESAPPEALPGEQRPQEPFEQLREERPVGPEPVAELPGKREHVLAVGGRRQEPVHEVGGGVGGPAGPARRAQAALAREGHQALLAARRTAEAGEAAAELPAIEEPPELLLDEPRVAGAVRMRVPALLKEALQVIADEGVEGRLLGLPAAVAARQRPRGGARLALVAEGRERGGRRGPGERRGRGAGFHAPAALHGFGHRSGGAHPAVRDGRIPLSFQVVGGPVRRSPTPRPAAVPRVAGVPVLDCESRSGTAMRS